MDAYKYVFYPLLRMQVVFRSMNTLFSLGMFCASISSVCLVISRSTANMFPFPGISVVGK